MQSAYPVLAVSEGIKNVLADTGHNGHVEYNVYGVGKLNTDLREFRADRTHRIGDNIHCTALVAAAGYVVKHLVGL